MCSCVCSEFPHSTEGICENELLLYIDDNLHFSNLFSDATVNTGRNKAIVKAERNEWNCLNGNYRVECSNKLSLWPVIRTFQVFVSSGEFGLNSGFRSNFPNINFDAMNFVQMQL